MPALFVLLLLLVIYGMTTGFMGQAAAFLFKPDWSVVSGGTFLSAMGQAFFTLSLGMCTMMTYGAYLPREGVSIGRVGLAVALGAYVAVTFVQVWMASRRDGATSADAIVVLGAAQYDCRPSPVLAQRLDHAHDLWQDDVAETIVVTGGKQATDRCTEAQSSANYLRDAGVPDEDLLLEVQGRNSWESLAATGRILRDRDLTRVVLLTAADNAAYPGSDLRAVMDLEPYWETVRRAYKPFEAGLASPTGRVYDHEIPGGQLSNLRVQAIAEQIGLDASVSPSHHGGSLPDLIKETGAVAVGRIVGFDRLVDIDDQIEGQLDETISDDEPTDVRSGDGSG